VGQLRNSLISISIVCLLLSTGFIGIQWDDNHVNAERARPSKFIVDLEGRGDFTNIHSAIDAARSGDTINVWAGTYYENVVIDKPLTVIGNHSSSTFIDARNSGTVVQINVDNVKFSGFGLMNSGDYYDIDTDDIFNWGCQAGAELYGENIHFFDNIVAYNYVGIRSISNNTIENNICLSNVYQDIVFQGNDNKIINNTCLVRGEILCYGDRNQLINNTCSNGEGIISIGNWNIIESNNLTDCYAISCSGEQNIITNNSCSKNNIGLYLSPYSYIYSSCENSTIMNNHFESNNYGVTGGGKNNIIKDNVFKNNSLGLSPGDNIVINNKFFNNRIGIELSNYYATTIKNNQFISCGFNFQNCYYTNYYHIISNTNTVNGKPVYYWNDVSNKTVPSGAGQIILFNCSNIKIENQNCSDSTSGIIVLASDYISLRNNTCDSNKRSGINIYGSKYVSVSNNSCSNNFYGIWIGSVGWNCYWYGKDINRSIIENNRCNKNAFGIIIHYNYGSILRRNKCFENRYNGIQIDGSEDIIVFNNTCKSNKLFGITIYSDGTFKLYNNKMIDCGLNVDIYYYESSNIICPNNTVNGKPVYFLAGANGTSIPSGAGQVILIDCRNITVKNQNLSNGSIGLFISDSQEIKIMNNKCNGNKLHGIRLLYSYYNRIENNTCNNNDYDGIRLDLDCNYNIIKNNTCNSNEKNGMFLDNCRYNKIYDNIFNLNNEIGYGQTGCSFDNLINNNSLNSNELYGFYIGGPSNNTLTNNKMKYCGIFLDGYYSDGWWWNQWDLKDIGSDNTVNNKPVLYLKDVDRSPVLFGAGQVILVNCSNLTITGQDLSYGTVGIQLIHSKYINIQNNNCNHNTYGIYLKQSSFIKIENNTCNNNNLHGLIDSWNSLNIDIINNQFNSNNGSGMYVNSINSTIKRNLCLSNKQNGMEIIQSHLIVIKNNIIGYNEQCGITIYHTYCSSIIYNTIMKNQDFAMKIDDARYYVELNNIIHHNNFIENNNGAEQANDICLFNRWYLDHVGNYWSDYLGKDNGVFGRIQGDGIGDSMLPIIPLDLYPSAVPFNCEFPPLTPQLKDPGEVDSDGDYSVQWNQSFLSVGYLLEEDINKSFSSPNLIFNGSNLNLSIVRKENGTYYYRVKAFNKYGESEWSNIEDIIVDWLPDIPKNFTALTYPPGNVLNLSWAPNVVDTVGYILYSNLTGNWSELVVNNGTENVTFDHTNLTDGESYYYRIRARDARGQLSNFSEILGIPWDSIPPAPPKGLRVINTTNHSILLTWEPNTEADLEGYNLYRSNVSNPLTWNKSIGTVEKGNEIYNDTGLDEGTTYYYVVTAFDEVPNESGYSNLANGTTKIGIYAPEVRNHMDDFEIIEDTVDNTSINLHFWFNDRNNDKLTFYCVGAQNISVDIDQSNGTVTLTPTLNWNGQETLTFFASDGILNTSDNVTVTVTPVNDPPETPTITSPSECSQLEFNQSFYLSAICWDPDIPYGDRLTYIWISNRTGEFKRGDSVSDVKLPFGIHSINLMVRDLAGATSNAYVNITVLPETISQKDHDEEDRNDTINSSKEPNRKAKPGGDYIGLDIIVIIIILIVLAIVAVKILLIKKKKKRDKVIQSPEETKQPTAKPELEKEIKTSTKKSHSEKTKPIIQPKVVNTPFARPLTTAEIEHLKLKKVPTLMAKPLNPK
jgi:parallel beta-helix repeat protein